MGIPHFLAVPFPVLGHLNPLMQFSHVLAKHGCKVTFLHTEFTHKRSNYNKDNTNLIEGSHSKNVKVVTLPDGLGPEDDRSDMLKVLLSIKKTMPNLLPKLIEDVNALDLDNKISCIIVTSNMGWALELGQKLGMKGALLSTTSAMSMASSACAQKLIDDGIIDSAGHPTRKQEIQLSPGMPTIDTSHFPWRGVSKTWFAGILHEMDALKVLVDWWLYNSTYNLESGAFSMSPSFLPIGPLIENDDTNNRNSFWQEDTTSLNWLDQQQSQSVIYVSFGSLAMLEFNQFKELALALDVIDKPFLWVVRDNDAYNSSYAHELRGVKGKIVNWVQQKKVLNHPAIACFVSHCGWNSTMEGVCAGIPFLCWPFNSDQFVSKRYVCDVWKVGLGLEKDETGFVSWVEIRNKVEQVIVDEEMKARSSKLKEETLNNIVEGGQSSNNLHMFINWAKG